MQELRQWQQECRTIEDMRSNALDSLRLLEGEVIHLQNADTQLKELKDEYNTLKGQVDTISVYLNLFVQMWELYEILRPLYNIQKYQNTLSLIRI